MIIMTQSPSSKVKNKKKNIQADKFIQSVDANYQRKSF